MRRRGARAGQGRFTMGAGANAGLHQQFIREKFLGVWGLLSRSPRTLPCHGARRGRFVTGRARTPGCTSNSFGKSSWGFGGFFQEAPERFPAMVPGGDGLSRDGRERRITSAIHSGKVLGGLGTSFKKPPTFLRIFVSSYLRIFVSSYLRIFSVIPHLRSADSMT